jgi:hypothetical protein
MTFVSATAGALLAAGLFGACAGAASAQVMPPPTEPVTQRHLYSMGNPGIPAREYTGGDHFLSTPWEMTRPVGSGFALGPVPDFRAPPTQGIVIQRVPAARPAAVTRRTVRRARPAVE